MRAGSLFFSFALVNGTRLTIPNNTKIHTMADENKPEEQIVDTEMAEQEQVEEVLEADKIIVVSLVFAQNWLVDSKLTFLQVTWRI
jgi:hypothetical protein